MARRAPKQPPASTATPPAQQPQQGDGLTIKLGPQTLVLAPPASMSMRYRIMYAAADDKTLACCAALGKASHKLDRLVASRHPYHVMRYGQDVCDYLLEQGIPYLDIEGAGLQAWAHVVTKGLLPASVVKEAEDFSGATTEDSTS